MQQNSNGRTRDRELGDRVLDDLTWEIQRYLLGDESIDRSAMEARMLDDPQFALLVADELQGLQDVCEAARQPEVSLAASPADGRFKSRLARYVSLAMCVVAAWLLCALYLEHRLQLSSRVKPVSESLAADSALQAIAEPWIALETQDAGWVLPEWESDPTYISYGFGEAVAVDPSTDDWMMNAGDFFRDVDI